jgi:hypothetical protein
MARAALALAAADGVGSTGPMSARAQTPLTTVRVAQGLTFPLEVAAPVGDDERLFVVEQAGLVTVLKNGAMLPIPYLDITDAVTTSGPEQGLLDFTFHPLYAQNGWSYVIYTRASDGATIVERYTVSATNPDAADRSSAAVVLGPVADPFWNHNGNAIQFGADRKLYVGMGDGGSSGDPYCHAQQGSTLWGKILRIHDDGSIPSDNPFVGNPNVLDEIWAFGFRQPWRFSADAVTGDLYFTDVGQDTFEEISVESGSSAGGLNYGWNVMEGTFCYGGSLTCPPTVPPCGSPAFVAPVHAYDHTDGCAVIGGHVYRGCAIPDLGGTYFFGDYCTGRIWSFAWNGSSVTNFQERTAELAPGGGLSIDLISSFGVDGRGELYVVDNGTGGADGEVFKIVPAAPATAVDLYFGKPGGNGVVPEFSVCGLLDSGNSAVFRVEGALPTTPGGFIYSWVYQPTPFAKGVLVPGMPFLTLAVVTDPMGALTFTVPGGKGPFTIYAQFIFYDPGATANVSFSNALGILWKP